MDLLERLISLTNANKITWRSREVSDKPDSASAWIDGFEVTITNFYNKRDSTGKEIKRTMHITSPYGVSVSINACLKDIQELVSLISEKVVTDFIHRMHIVAMKLGITER